MLWCLSLALASVWAVGTEGEECAAAAASSSLHDQIGAEDAVTNGNLNVKAAEEAAADAPGILKTAGEAPSGQRVRLADQLESYRAAIPKDQKYQVQPRFGGVPDPLFDMSDAALQQMKAANRAAARAAKTVRKASPARAASPARSASPAGSARKASPARTASPARAASRGIQATTPGRAKVPATPVYLPVRTEVKTISDPAVAAHMDAHAQRKPVATALPSLAAQSRAEIAEAAAARAARGAPKPVAVWTQQPKPKPVRPPVHTPYGTFRP